MYAVVNHVGGKSDVAGLSSAMDHLFQTLLDIQKFVTEQKNYSRFVRVVKASDDATKIAQFNKDLDNALQLFQIKTTLLVLQQLIHVLPKGEQEAPPAPTDNLSLCRHFLPPAPSTFYGREKVVDEVVQKITTEDPAHVAILGTGGIGKTSVSLAFLHRAEVVSLHGDHRWFISCEAASAPQGLISTIAIALNQTGDNVYAKILKFFKEQPRTLLVLDNFETPWEPASGRRETEDILASLTSIKSLNLIVTLRGSERPLKTQWTRPFLPPLSPLDLQAARSAFLANSDILERDPNLVELLQVVDNLPLAITLVANLAHALEK